MAMDELFHAIDPDPTQHPVQLDRIKYDLMRAVILGNLQENGPMTIKELGALIEEQMQGLFDGSVRWYFTKVKNDLEARGEIRRVLNLKPCNAVIAEV